MYYKSSPLTVRGADCGMIVVNFFMYISHRYPTSHHIYIILRIRQHVATTCVRTEEMRIRLSVYPYNGAVHRYRLILGTYTCKGM